MSREEVQYGEVVSGYTGCQDVFSGGTAIGTVLSSGGAQNVSIGGTALSTMIPAGGTQTIFSGG